MPSQNYLQELTENLDKYTHGLNDTFQFKCCRHRDDILLSPIDFFNIARQLKLSQGEVLEEYCDTYIGGNSRIPIVRLKPQDKTQNCPLLQNNRCIVHEAKPSVCAMYPVGRFTMHKKDGTNTGNESSSICYLINPVHCGGHKTYTVRSWLEQFRIDPEDPVYLLWTDTAARLGAYIRELDSNEKKLPDSGYKVIWNLALQLLYLGYDTENDFRPQFEENVADMWRTIEELDAKAIQPFLRGDVRDGT